MVSHEDNEYIALLGLELMLGIGMSHMDGFRSLPTSRHSGVGLCDTVRACWIKTPVGSRGTATFQRGMMSYHGQLGGGTPVGSCGTDSFLAWNDGLPQAARRHKLDYTCVGPK
uniref:Uncharacterized protein n=1 Tax=Ananas comosus var. bracteatus TaxID=296719 RepID=A0A6V7PVX2_ANACO|nr:unnamed protein product [Ananas comosus var. bracteatus]